MARVRSTIISELQDHKKSIDNPEFVVIQDIDEHPFKSVFLNVDAYDSLLHSGLFTYFDQYTQDRLSNLYLRIRLNNTILQERFLIKSRFMMEYSEDNTSKWRSVIHIHDYMLNKYQTEITGLMENVEELLQKDTGPI